jgi:arylsulfatase A-like enzyme
LAKEDEASVRSALTQPSLGPLAHSTDITQRMQARRPNILLITLDQWRADHLGARDGVASCTPHLDALAREATVFEQHYCQAYPCGPSRASLLTGLYPHKHRSVSNGTPLDARHPTLFGELRKGGYTPILFGYTDTTLDPRGKPDDHPDNGDYENVCPGLDVGMLLTETALPWLDDLERKGHTVDRRIGRAGVLRQTRFDRPTIYRAEDSEAAFLTDRFLAWLPEPGDEPFCAHLSLITPHPPFAAPAPFHDAFSPADSAKPIRAPSADEEAAQHPLTRALMESVVKAHRFAKGLTGVAATQDQDTIRQVRAIYAGMVKQADHELGRVFDALKAQGHWHDTVIVVTADHGEQLFDHYLLGKTAFFDQSAHIPLIVRLPGADADAGRGKRLQCFTESVDIMPTLLGMAGLPVPGNCDGASLQPWCNNAPKPTLTRWRDEVHWSFDFRDIVTHAMENLLDLPSTHCHLQVLRTARLKYVHFAGLPPVLFDLEQDPHESINRADDPAARDLLMEGLQRMMNWRLRHEDQALTGYLARSGTLYQQR